MTADSMARAKCGGWVKTRDHYCEVVWDYEQSRNVCKVCGRKM